MNAYWFKVVTVLVCLLLLSASTIALLAYDHISDTAFIMACLIWLLLPAAIYRELFYSRYCLKDHVTDVLRRRRPRVFTPHSKSRTHYYP